MWYYGCLFFILNESRNGGSMSFEGERKLTLAEVPEPTGIPPDERTCHNCCNNRNGGDSLLVVNCTHPIYKRCGEVRTNCSGFELSKKKHEAREGKSGIRRAR